MLGDGGKVTPFGEQQQQQIVQTVIEPMASDGLRTSVIGGGMTQFLGS